MRPLLLAMLLLEAAAGAGSSCGRSQFQCIEGGSCIAASWVCDGTSDCPDGSDESPANCSSVSCSPSQFLCGGPVRRCLPASWLCDGHHDCPDGSDERDCAPRSCPPDHLPCGPAPTTSTSGTGITHPDLPSPVAISCVSVAFACDGEWDCPDGADEASCPSPSPCPPGSFRCDDSSCLPPLWLCDGDHDCPDGSDEKLPHCHPPPQNTSSPSSAAATCPPLQFRCSSGLCIHRGWRCDGTPDCPDGSDEEGCGPRTCHPDQFRCLNGHCIPGLHRCDGQSDCSDASDEQGCHNVRACDPSREFKCHSGECVPLTRLCDSRRDCSDWSDEPLKECGVNECLDGGGGCSHGCRDLPLGFECFCPGGFTLGEDGKTCKDIDECQDPQSCSQRCHNLPGSFKCDCWEGFRLDPSSGSCRALDPSGSLLFTNRHEIRLLALDGTGYRRVLGSLSHAAALDVEVASGTIYWGDPIQGKIYRSQLSQPDAPPVVLVSGGSPDGVALDWLHQCLYWSDSSHGTIAVVDTGGRWSRVLVRERGAKPQGIALDPLNGYMYWTDWGEHPKIAKGGLNGVDQFPLVTDGIEWPNGITLDQPSQRLYWADSRLHSISSIDVDGGRRQLVLADPDLLPHPFALAFFEDRIYWTDPQLGSLLSGWGRPGAPPGPLPAPRRLLPQIPTPGDLVLLHPLRQPPGLNPCVEAKSCPFLCVGAPRDAPGSPQFSCLCPEGLNPGSNGSGCYPDPSASPPSNGTPDPPTAPPLLPLTPSLDSPSTSGSSNTTAGARVPGGSQTGSTVLAVILPLGFLVLVAGGLRALWRGWRRRSTNSINFSNPLYLKQPEDEEPLASGGFDHPMPQSVTLDDDAA